MFYSNSKKSHSASFSSSYLSKAGITTSNQPVLLEQVTSCSSPKTKLSGSTDFDFGILINNNSTDQGNVSQSQKNTPQQNIYMDTHWKLSRISEEKKL